MKKLFVFIAMGVSISSSAVFAQRVFYTSQDITTPYTGKPIRTIHPHWNLSSVVTVIYADGTKQRIPREQIWGYEDSRGRLFRYSKDRLGNAFYQVVRQADVVTYRLQRTIRKGVIDETYYSQTLDSPIRWTERKARRDLTQVR